jgi:hypothetical protein
MNTYKVLELVTPYFNTPEAAEVFLIRQCQSHLQREPAELGDARSGEPSEMGAGFRWPSNRERKSRRNE